MNQILIPVIIVAAIGLILGLVLAVAAKVFAVPVNETTEKVRACLPGANCGACGFSGCDGYASAIGEGKTEDLSLCGPGGVAAYAAIAEVMGKTAKDAKKMVAAVLCQGNEKNAQTKLIYRGVDSCKMAAQLYGGPKACTYGCLGFGDCMDQCHYEAIFLCDGVARINPANCRACRACIKVCPKGLIELFPADQLRSVVLCKNKDKGMITRKACIQGCIGCGKCVRTCTHDAIILENNLARVDQSRCVGCGECVGGCPTGAISVIKL